MTARNPPLVGSRLFAGLATPLHCYSSQAALAAWLRIVAGQARMLHEMVLGHALADPGNAGNHVTPCAPPSPKGGVGEHHTGAGHGRPIRHSLLSVAYAAGANMPNAPAGVTNRQPPTLQRDAFPPAGTINGKLSLEYEVAAPACWPGGCYETAQIVVGAYVPQAAASSSGTLTVYTEPSGGLGGLGVELAIVTTSTGWKTASGTISLTPGQRQIVTCVLDVSNGYDVTVQIGGVAISQVS